jgi:IclR family transcriptional regulator, acetate operon repressor
VQNVLRSLTVLEAVSQHQPVGVGSLARLLDMPKSTVQRSLITLAQAGWIHASSGSQFTTWMLTSRALAVGLRASRETGLREAALGPMQQLRDATNETVHLTVPDGLNGVVLIERVDTTQPVRAFHKLGTTMSPLSATSTGRVILAHLAEDRVQGLLNGMSASAKRDIRREINQTRLNGYAVTVNQYSSGVAAVGAAVLGSESNAIAGICISMPDARFNVDYVDAWGEQVKKAAGEIGANLADG